MLGAPLRSLEAELSTDNLKLAEANTNLVTRASLQAFEGLEGLSPQDSFKNPTSKRAQ